MVKKKSIKIDSPPPSLNWRLQFSPGIIIQDRHDLMFFVISFYTLFLAASCKCSRRRRAGQAAQPPPGNLGRQPPGKKDTTSTMCWKQRILIIKDWHNQRAALTKYTKTGVTKMNRKIAFLLKSKHTYFCKPGLGPRLNDSP